MKTENVSDLEREIKELEKVLKVKPRNSRWWYMSGKLDEKKRFLASQKELEADIKDLLTKEEAEGVRYPEQVEKEWNRCAKFIRVTFSLKYPRFFDENVKRKIAEHLKGDFVHRGRAFRRKATIKEEDDHGRNIGTIPKTIPES